MVVRVNGIVRGKPVYYCERCKRNVKPDKHPCAAEVELTPEAILRQLKSNNPHLPRGWNRWPASLEAMKQLHDQHAEQAAFAIPPETFEGRGIVTVGGGVKYFTCAYVLLWTLRELGCRLPIELWYLGNREMGPQMLALAESLGAECVDAIEATKGKPRILGGWQCKVWAIMGSRFQEVLFLDSDQVPAIDPSGVFDWLKYQECGAVFWQDLPNGPGLDITQEAFEVMRLPVPGKTRFPRHDKPTDYRPFESGQMIIDKRRCWSALDMTRRINDYSDFWFPSPAARNHWHIYGDKSTFYLGFNRMNRWHEMPGEPTYAGDGNGGAFLQTDFGGNVVFQHRVQPPTKYRLDGDNLLPIAKPGEPEFVNHDLMQEALKDLRGKWNGRIE